MGFLIEKIKNNKNYQFGIFCVVLFVLSLFVQLYYNPTYKGDDFYFHYRRFSILIESIFYNGTFPSYIDHHAIEGYGYLSNIFYSDVILIPFTPIAYLTGNIFLAYNFMLFTMTVLSGIFMYKTINIIYKNQAMAFVTALIYTFSAYRLFDEYNRSALGEYISFTFLPLIFLGAYYIIKGNYKKWYILTIGYSLLIYTHALSSLLVFIILIIFLIINGKSLIREYKRILYLILAGVITIFLTSYYTLPLLEQTKDDLYYFNTQAWIIPFMKKQSLRIVGEGIISGIIPIKRFLYAGIGILLILGIIPRIFIKEKSKELLNIDLFTIAGVVLILLTSSITPWGRFPLNLLDVIQFPWRLYEFATFFLSISGGYYLTKIVKTNKQYLIAFFGVIFIILYTVINYANFYNNKFRENITQLEKPNKNNHYLGGGLEYIPAKNGQVDPLYVRGDSVRSLFNSSKIYSIERKNRFTHFNIITNTPDSLELPLLYYKGYTAELNGITLPVTQSNNGLVQIPVNESGHIKAYYAGTVIQKISFYISLFSTLAFCTFILYYIRKNRSIKKINKYGTCGD